MRAALAIAVLLLSGAPALACSPVLFQGEGGANAQLAGDEVLARQPVFLGKIQILNVTKDDAEVTLYDSKVLKQYLGEPMQELTAMTNETSSCAFVGKPGDTLLVALNKNVEDDFTIFSLSNYYYGVPESDVEAYLDTWKASGNPVPALVPTAAQVTETGEAVDTSETLSPAPAPVAEEPAL